MNYRIVQVPFSDSSRRIIAVSGVDPPFPVLIYDAETRLQIAHCSGHRDPICGLASLSSSERLSSNPMVVSGGCDDFQILLFDATNGTKLGELEEAPQYTLRLLHVPEWNVNDLFAGGATSHHGFCYRYDLTTKRKIQKYEHQMTVFGFCAIVSRNLLISCSENKIVRVWPSHVGGDCSCQFIIRTADEGSSCCSIEEKNLIVVGLKNGSVEVFDIRRSEESIRTIELCRGKSSVTDIVQIDRDRCMCGSAAGSLAIFDPDAGVLSRTTLKTGVFGVCVLGDLMSDESFFEIEDRLRFLRGRSAVSWVSLRLVRCSALLVPRSMLSALPV